MGFFLGIDGGGSKTECVLGDASGAVLARAVGAGANLRRTDATSLRQLLSDCFRELRRSASLHALDCDVVCGGFAGAGQPEPQQMARAVLAELLRPRWLYVLGDMEVALEAAVGGGCGVVLLAGTGSIAYGRNGKGEVARAGGEGPAVGDEGSGYAIGRAAVEVVLQAGKGRAPETRLTSPLCDALRVSRPEELSQRLSPANAAELAALLPVVVEAARAGDTTAREILRQAGEALAGVAVKVLQQLDLLTGDVRLATSGGVFAASEEVFNRVRTVIARVASRVRVERLVVSPAEGALRLGQRLWLEESAGGRK